MKIITSLAVALGFACSCAHAQTFELTVKSGAATFVHKPVFESGMSNFMQEVVSKDGGSRRMLIANLNPTPDGYVMIQVELTTLDRRESFQYQTAVQVRPGASVTFVQCGGYSAKLSQGGKPGTGAMDNHRVTLDALFGEDAGRCVAVVNPGSQFNLVSPIAFGESRKRLLLNGLLTRDGAGYALEYQLELGGGAAQARATLKPGEKKAVLSKGDLSATLSAGPAK